MPDVVSVRCISYKMLHSSILHARRLVLSTGYLIANVRPKRLQNGKNHTVAMVTSAIYISTTFLLPDV